LHGVIGINRERLKEALGCAYAIRKGVKGHHKYMSRLSLTLVGTRCRSLLLLIAIGWPSTLTAQSLSYPAAPRDNVIDDYHGTGVADPYRWLEQPDGARAAEWLKAQNRLSFDYLGSMPNREAIRRRLSALWNYARTDVPWREAGRLFYVGNTGLQPQSVLYVQNGLHDPPRRVLDPGKISRDGSIAVRDYAVSPDGRLLSYRTSRGGADVGETRVREISTGRDLGEAVYSTLTSVCWTHDGRGFFYIRPPVPKLGDAAFNSRIEKQLFYHVLGQPQSRDRRIHEWKENSKWVYCMMSEDGHYAIVVAEQGTESEMYALDLGDPKRPDVTAPLIRLLGDYKAFHTPIDIVGSILYVRTNLEAARQRVIALDLRDGTGARPRTIIPESSDVIVDAAVAGGRLAVHYIVDVKSRLRLFALDGQPLGEIALPGIGAVGWPLSGRGSAPELFYSFTSFLVPSSVYRYDLRTGASTPFRPAQAPFDRSVYETRQVFYMSKDGTRVPMFITAAKNLRLDGKNPTLLTGYGGYGANMEPSYEPDIPLWLEGGGVYAVANLRGGGEYGADWHRAGMLERKQTSFDDFIAGAEYLIAEGYTTPGKLAIYGHSNGGLLVGAAITQRPDLFAAAVANAGHYDMIRYHKFTVGAGWITEYGSPDDPTAFRYLRAYSPLHNVRSGTCYPATLLLAADHDDRVVPSHSYKFAAALQAAQGCSRPILLRVTRDASHNYASRQAQIAERSDMWAFVSARLGIWYRNGRRSLWKK
jgi:prolyl oligopeptidase